MWRDLLQNFVVTLIQTKTQGAVQLCNIDVQCRDKRTAAACFRVKSTRVSTAGRKILGVGNDSQKVKQQMGCSWIWRISCSPARSRLGGMSRVNYLVHIPYISIIVAQRDCSTRFQQTGVDEYDGLRISCSAGSAVLQLGHDWAEWAESIILCTYHI
jgi:hypothetical protein